MKKKYKHTNAEKNKLRELNLKTSEVMPETEFREKILNFARINGIYIEVKNILDRYEKLLERETDAKTREQIATLGISELHKYINFSGGLTVNLKEIIPAQNDDNKDDNTIILTSK
jgi:hypothetical protein